MPLDLFKVERIDTWPVGPVTVYLIKGETVEERPRWLTLKTIKPLFAAACERAKETGTYVSAGWRQNRNFGEGDLITCELDRSKFSYDEAS